MIGPVPLDLLTPPSGFVRKQIWPPDLGLAEAIAASHARNDGRDGKGESFLGPTAYPADFILRGCARALAATCDADLIDAYRDFVDVSNLYRGKSMEERRRGVRAIAACNAAATLAMLGHRGALLLAFKEIDESKRWADARVRKQMKKVTALVSFMLADLLHLARLRGRGRLVPTSAAGRQRVLRMPRHRIDGTWLGVRTLLENWGLEAPVRPDGERVSIRVEGEEIAVSAWEPSPELAALAG